MSFKNTLYGVVQRLQRAAHEVSGTKAMKNPYLRIKYRSTFLGLQGPMPRLLPTCQPHSIHRPLHLAPSSKPECPGVPQTCQVCSCLSSSPRSGSRLALISAFYSVSLQRLRLRSSLIILSRAGPPLPQCFLLAVRAGHRKVGPQAHTGAPIVNCCNPSVAAAPSTLADTGGDSVSSKRSLLLLNSPW